MCLICVSTISIAALMAPSDAPDQMPTQSPAQISMKVSGTNSSSPLIPANSANLSEKDKKNAQVPFLAWNEIVNYKVASTNKVKVQVHASKNFDEKAKKLFVKGAQSSADQFSSVFKPNDTIHLILATNYDDAVKLINDVKPLLPSYESFTQRHLLVAKDIFTGVVPRPAKNGGTSSRNCYYQGGPQGDTGGSQITPCPDLDGGVVHWFDPKPETEYVMAEATGSHEVLHIVFSKMNQMSHYRVPNWIIEGTMQSISIATVTKKDRLKEMPSLFTPVPSWTPLENGKSYDLSILENENSVQSKDTFSIGTLAISLLISEVGAKKVFDFMSVVGFPRQWKDVFLESFGFSAEDFYKRFSDYHSWYFYQNGFQTIQSTNYLPIASKKVSPKTINCANGKTTKKVSGTNPKCPKGYKVKV